MAAELPQDFPALIDEFEWAKDVCINFIGVFDTVAAIADPLRGNFSVGDSLNPGVNLFLPPGCARKVVHLTAADEHRHNFSLNRVHSSHEELILPGVHSNLCRDVYYSPETIDRRKLEQSRAWRGREVDERELRARGLPGTGEFIYENIALPASTAKHYQNRPARDVMLALGLQREVRGELSRISLRVMHAKATQNGVPFDVLSEREKRFSIPTDLQPIAAKVISAAMIGQNAVLTVEEKRFLHSRYIHSFANWTSTSGFMVNKPRRDNHRAVYADQPQQGYPV